MSGLKCYIDLKPYALYMFQDKSKELCQLHGQQIEHEMFCSPAGSDDDFAPSSQQPQAAATAPADDPAVDPAGSITSLPWNEQHKYALVNFVTTMFEVNDSRDDDPQLWEQLAARVDLWGPYKVTPAELQQVYITVSMIYVCYSLCNVTYHIESRVRIHAEY